MNGIKPNVAHMEEEIKKKAEELCSDIATQCSSKFLDEIDPCLNEIDAHISKLSDSMENAKSVLSEVSGIETDLKENFNSAQELMSSLDDLKEQIDVLCSGISQGIAKSKEIVEQSAITKESITGVSKQYTEQVSTELEKLMKYASVWNLKIDTIVQEHSKKIEALATTCSNASGNINDQSKSLCNTIIDINKKLVSFGEKCTTELHRIQSDYEKLLTVLNNNCAEAEESTKNYLASLKISEEKISSLFNDFQINNEKFDEVLEHFRQFAQIQADKVEAMNKAAKTHFIITTSLLCVGILVQLILHFI